MNRKSLEEAIQNKETTQARVQVARENLKDAQDFLKNLEKPLYDASIKELHIKEIYRLAEHQFTRLKGSFTDMDIIEVEKWIGRAKNSIGLINIIEAFKEIDKYTKNTVARNLYALIQKIIIEGPYKGKKE